ncbi:MAG: hypothetical protein AB7U82_00465 [Blastocatellales bacterium]
MISSIARETANPWVAACSQPIALKSYSAYSQFDGGKSWIEESALRMSQIIAGVGAGDESHFRRKFKKAIGLTLTECRKRYDLRDESEDDGKTQPAIKSACK